MAHPLFVVRKLPVRSGDAFGFVPVGDGAFSSSAPISTFWLTKVASLG